MAVAIDIGNRKIKIVKGDMDKRGGVVINKYINADTPEGCIENGHIKNYTEMQIFFRNLINTNKLKGNAAYITVRSSDIVSREITVPVLKKDKLVKVIQNEIVGVFGNISNYYIDYAIMGKDMEEYLSVYKIMAYAIPKDMVIGYHDLFNAANLKPSVLDVHRNSIHKLLKERAQINGTDISDKGIILVDIGSNNMDLDLIADCRSVFKRSIIIGHELGTSSMNYDVTGAHSGLFDEDGEGEFDFLLGAQNPASRALFSKVNEELYKMIQFSASRENGKRVEAVYLYGGNSRITGMTDYLSNSLDVKVERITALSNVELKAEAELCDIIPVSASLIRVRG